MYKHIIWDWNGTLLDDVKISYMLSAKELELSGVVVPTAEEFRKKFHHPMKDFYQEIGVDYSKRSYQEITDHFHASYLLYLDECFLFDDVVSTLSTFQSWGLTQSILSALPHTILVRTVAERKIRQYFTDVLGLASNAADSKVANGKAWFEKTDFSPSDLLMIGDTTHDFEVAQALNIDCMLVSRGCQDREVLEKTGAAVFNSLSELVSHVERLKLKEEREESANE